MQPAVLRQPLTRLRFPGWQDKYAAVLASAVPSARACRVGQCCMHTPALSLPRAPGRSRGVRSAACHV